jgi:hypothetical protein
MTKRNDPVLDRYIDRLTATFRAAGSKHEAHRRSQAILQDMAADPGVLPAVFRKHIETPGSLNTKHYPVVAINVTLNPHYSLELNSWITLPDGQTNLSTKAIHHHGELLLTTVTAFGPGYEHWTFQRPELIDGTRELYRLKLRERAAHPLHHVAFVDSHVPHLPMYPPSLSITLALWSGLRPTTWKDRVKRIGLLKRNEKLLKAAARRLGLARSLDLKIVEYFDFYPTEDGFKGMRQRVEFGRGPNEDYLYSLFHILQETGSDGLAPAVQRHLDSAPHLENPQIVAKLLRDLRDGRPIRGRLSPGHYGVPHANFTAQDIERALEASAVGRHPAATADRPIAPHLTNS